MQAEEVWTGVVVSGLSNLVVRLCIEVGPKSKMATSVNQASTRACTIANDIYCFHHQQEVVGDIETPPAILEGGRRPLFGGKE